MENSLKQRVVGAIVLIALAVIFLPAILKEKEKQEPFISQIPAKPADSMPKEFPADVVAKNEEIQQALDQLDNPERKEKIDSNNINLASANEKETSESKAGENNSLIDVNVSKVDEFEAETKKETVKDRSVKESQQTVGPDFQDAAWIIQIASFSNKGNAISFVEKLKNAGHKAYRQEIKTSQKKIIYRVYTGPYIKKEEAEKALKNVNQVSKLSGIIMLFDPTKQ